MKIYDGKGCIVGRVASKAAKESLKGEKIEIYNAKDMIFTGNKKDIIKKYKGRLALRDMAKPVQSPHYPKKPDLFVKRMIRNMLPWRSSRGKNAYKRIKVYMDAPKEKAEKVFEFNKDIRYITVKEVCIALGWKGI